jgi:hypothetical protein
LCQTTSVIEKNESRRNRKIWCLKTHDVDGPLDAFTGEVDGFTLDGNCFAIWKLNKDTSVKPIKGLRFKYCVLLCFPGYDINEACDRLPQKYWSLQDLYNGCDFYSMVTANRKLL